ncbi:MAG: hypothetical protein Q9209_002096 [Squamulea sp. 1 TL-2023]
MAPGLSPGDHPGSLGFALPQSASNDRENPHAMCKEAADVLAAYKASWEKEPKGDMDKIADLEKRLRRYALSQNDTLQTTGSTEYRSHPGPCETYLKERTGNHVQQEVGTRSGVQTMPGQLHNTTENMPPKSGSSLSGQHGQSESASKPSSIDPLTGQYYDGIYFKSVASSSGYRSTPSGWSTAPSSLSRQSSITILRESPPTVARESSPTIPREPSATVPGDPKWVLPVPVTEMANFTKDAGHTPMARTNLGLDGTGSAVGSNLPTPKLQQEVEVVPLEPPPSTGPPTERSDSYFPSQPEDDPVLQGPLTLKSEDTGNDEFMSRLKSQLLKASENSTPPAAASAPGNSD